MGLLVINSAVGMNWIPSSNLGKQQAVPLLQVSTAIEFAGQQGLATSTAIAGCHLIPQMLADDYIYFAMKRSFVCTLAAPSVTSGDLCSSDYSPWL